MANAENFTPEKFRDWADDMSYRLVTLMQITGG